MSSPRKRLLFRTADPVEPIEDAARVLAVHPDPDILDFDDGVAPVVSQADVDPVSLTGVCDRVRQQIVQHQPDALTIDADRPLDLTPDG